MPAEGLEQFYALCTAAYRPNFRTRVRTLRSACTTAVGIRRDQL